MHQLKTELLRLADDLVAATANAGISFALLSDGRDLVELVPGDGEQTAVFSDHADEGWPAFELRIPPSLEFDSAFFGVLGRRAQLRSALPADALRAEFEAVAGVTMEGRARGWQVELAGEIEVAIADADSGSILAVRQMRDAEAVGEALRTRARRWSAEDSGAGESDAEDSGTEDSGSGGDEGAGASPR